MQRGVHSQPKDKKENRYILLILLQNKATHRIEENGTQNLTIVYIVIMFFSTLVLIVSIFIVACAFVTCH